MKQTCKTILQLKQKYKNINLYSEKLKGRGSQSLWIVYPGMSLLQLEVIVSQLDEGVGLLEADRDRTLALSPCSLRSSSRSRLFSSLSRSAGSDEALVGFSGPVVARISSLGDKFSRLMISFSALLMAAVFLLLLFLSTASSLSTLAILRFKLSTFMSCRRSSSFSRLRMSFSFSKFLPFSSVSWEKKIGY